MIRQTDASIWRALEVFQTICKCGGFSAAQDALALSQSTISNHVANLEEHLGYSLCLRGRKGFQLTERGKAVLESYSKLAVNITNFKEEVLELKNDTRGVLRVGILDHTITEDSFSTVNVIKRFSTEAPKVELRLLQNTQLNLHNAIVDEEIDLAISVHVSGSKLVKATRLYDELHHVYCGAEHPFFNLPARRLSQMVLEETDWVTNGHPPGAFSLLPFPVRKNSVVADNIESVAVTILAGRHVGYLPQHFAERYEKLELVKRVHPQKYSQVAEISVIFKAGRRQSAATRLFRETCIEQIAKTSRRPKS